MYLFTLFICEMFFMHYVVFHYYNLGSITIFCYAFFLSLILYFIIIIRRVLPLIVCYIIYDILVLVIIFIMTHLELHTENKLGYTNKLYYYYCCC